MKNSGNINSKVVIIAVIILVIIILVFFFRQPTEPKDRPIKYAIGVFSTTETMNISYIQTGELACTDINEYCQTNGLDLVFDFKYECAESQPPKALEITQRFHEQGINIIVGYDWGSMLDCVDYYGKNMGVVMISPRGVNVYRGLYPHIFTLGPTVSTEARAASWLVRDFNITRLVVFKRYSYSGISSFLDGFIESTGQEIIIETVPFAESSDYTVDSKYIEDLETAVAESSRIGETGVLFMGDIGLHDVMKAASWSEELSSVNWFATYDAIFAPGMFPDISLVGENDVKVYLLRDVPLNNTEYNRLTGLFEETYCDSDSRFQPYLYDSLWVTALTLIETGTTHNETVIARFPAIASGFEGATGRCQLDDYNQRYSTDYDILCYSLQDSVLFLDWCGTVNSDESITWFETPIQLE